MNKYPMKWFQDKDLSSIRYVCGYCGADTAPAHGYYTEPGQEQGFIAICTNCNRPTFIETVNGSIVSTTPAAKIGKDVGELPADIGKLYDEARKCSAAAAYTAAVLACRKILMHVAVEKGAKPNQSFVDYVDYLAKNGYVPPDGRDWVDYIRTKSNEANHEIKVMDQEDAEDLITFVEMLLRLVYEFKGKLAKRTTPKL